MNMKAQPGALGELRRQSAIVRSLGSDFVADVLEAGERQLDCGARTAALIAGWRGDAAAAALALRFNAGVHALARRGGVPRLSALFRREHDDYDGALRDALTHGDSFIAQWMRTPTQTNEVARAAALAAALLVLSDDFGMPLELLELGSSCGLNLNLARYRYNLGGVAAGDAESRIVLQPVWEGMPPPAAPIRIKHAMGVDLDPLDPLSGDTRERLLSFVFADQPARMARLEAALEVARCHLPRVDRADALDWLPRHIEAPQDEGICRVVMHSMVKQYFTRADQDRFVRFLNQAGARATVDRPLAWISFEWTTARDEVQLVLTQWPSRMRRILAICHPYGERVRWLEGNSSM